MANVERYVPVSEDHIDDYLARWLQKLLAFDLMLSENTELVGKAVIV